MKQSPQRQGVRLQIVLPLLLKEKLGQIAADRGQTISVLVKECIEEKLLQSEREVPADEFYISEGCFITEWSNNPEDPDASIARARVKPGVTTRWHRLNGTTERYVIIKGCGLVEVGSLPSRKVGFGDVVVIPPEAPQRITNTGRRDLIFLAICTPRFRMEVYEDIDDAFAEMP